MKKILIVVGHPNIENSKINKFFLDNIKEENISIKLFNEFNENSFRKELVEYDKIIFQYPLYWYSVPGEFKSLIDKSFKEGWAFMTDDPALKEKEFGLCITTGGPKESYSNSGYNLYSMEQINIPLIAITTHTKMNYIGNYLMHGVRHYTDEDLQKHLKEYINFLNK